MIYQSIPKHPLKWPRGVPRTKPGTQKNSQFGKLDWDKALKKLYRELELIGASYITLSSNQKIRLDGKPYAQEHKIDDPGVAVYFTLDGEQICFPCDRWLKIVENIRAITLHIESIRGQGRWGVGTAKQAFAGYKALPANAGEVADWWAVLGIAENATVDQIKAAHRALAKFAHPDNGGSAEEMAQINMVRDRALAEREAR